MGDHDPQNTLHEWRPTVTETEGDSGEKLPSLPWSSPILMIPEVEFNIKPAPCYGTEGREWGDDLKEDAEGSDSEPAGTPRWTHSISFGLLSAPRDRFIENVGHPLALSMPGLFPWNAISPHSSLEQVSDMGDNDPHGLCAEALDEAINLITIRSARLVDVVEADESGTNGAHSRINELRSRWIEACSDLMGPIPLELPPLREINHEINLVDELAKYNFHLPRCPEVLRPELRSKIQRYTQAGWWEMTPVPQAAPLLCIPKKDNKLRTVVDARQRNDNTVKDVTPFPD
ncbi:hypothetical protein K438DRAFT_1991387 [Mycena galopus ATCC 62051]|nr:hypothetical protein K438DRAFT_1991387 [Mycena galopus ATCC 62051]